MALNLNRNFSILLEKITSSRPLPLGPAIFCARLVYTDNIRASSRMHYFSLKLKTANNSGKG